MTATVEVARPKEAKGPIRPPGNGFLSRVPEGFATFFGALGLLCVLLAFIAPLRRVLRPVVRFLDLLIVPVSANLAYAVFLFLLAAATAARKKIAWWLVVVYLGLLVLTDALGVALGLYAESLPSLIVCALLLVLLIVARRQFYAASRRAAVRRALAVLLVGLAVGILVELGAGRPVPRHPPHEPASRLGRRPGLRRPGLRPLLRRPPAPRPVLPPRPLRRARPPQRGHRPLPLPTPRSGPARRRGGPHPRPPEDLRRSRLARLLRHPARQGRRLLAQRQGRRHLPRRGSTSASPAATRSATARPGRTLSPPGWTWPAATAGPPR